RLRQPEGGAGQGGGVAADEAGDELEAEEDQHHEDRDAEQDVVDRHVFRRGDVDQGGGVEDRPDGLEQPPGGGAHGSGEPVERRRDQAGGGFAGGVADGRDEGDIAHTHRRPLPYAESRRLGGWGSDLLADVPEEVDQRDGRAADDGGAA